MKLTINNTLAALLTAVVALLLTAVASAAPKKSGAPLTADSVFMELQPPVLDMLSRSARFEMLEYFKVDSIYDATNSLGGKSRLETVTPEYLKAQITDVSTLEIRILPLKKGGDIAVVSYTVDSTGAQADSQLFFVSGDGSLLEGKKLFRAPELKHFFHIDKGSVTKMGELVDMVQFPTIEYILSPDTTELKGRLTVGEYMDVDDYNIMKLFLVPQITWTWNGSKYVENKNK